jgi:hypothetical protein
METRQHCATCIHIARVETSDGAFFRCERLGWRTEPRYQFQCWVERPRTVKMTVRGEAPNPTSEKPAQTPNQGR